jgi:hypothetical protein
MNASLSPLKKVPKSWGYFCSSQKTAQSRQSPNGLKFAQSGHPGPGLNSVTVILPIHQPARCTLLVGGWGTYDSESIFLHWYSYRKTPWHEKSPPKRQRMKTGGRTAAIKKVPFCDPLSSCYFGASIYATLFAQ